MLNHVVEHLPGALDNVFGAMADPTRRAILRELGSSPARVTDIAKRFPVSLNAISKHLMVLERAGLVQREIRGRDHICRLDLRPMRKASAWMEEMHAFWEARLDALELHVAEKRRRRK
jgi:DNA-binding transcriptional ArsR family regulator